MLAGCLSAASIACGPSGQADDTDARPCSGSETFCGTDPQGHDICVDLSTDASHCGACFSECRLPETNACVDGQCACAGNGNVADACDPGTACVAATGQCIRPDLDATETCDPIEGTGCTDNRTVCADGFCTIPNCSGPEICNGLDDDCDGHLDTTGPAPGPGTPLTESCYSGPPGTENVGLCKVGHRTCQNGAYPEECRGEQPPVAENGLLLCDGDDNDCDACPDNNWNDAGVCEPPHPFKADIIFVLDRSFSMNNLIDAVVEGVMAWAADIGQNPSVHFGLVNPTTDNDPDGVSVTWPLSGYEAFNEVMATVIADGSSHEPMHYAAQKVLSGAYDAALGTRQDAARFVIVISDASALGENHVVGYDEESVCAAVPSDTMLIVITHAYYFDEWDACTSEESVPPTARPITGDMATTLLGLRLVISTPCF